MEKEQIVTKLTEVIHDVLPELDEVDMHANMVNEYGVNSVSLIRLLVAAERAMHHRRRRKNAQRIITGSCGCPGT